MSLSNLAITVGTGVSLAMSETGTVNLKADGVTIQNGLHLTCLDDPDFRVRRQMTLKTRPSVYDPKTKLFSKEKTSMSFVHPTDVGGGVIAFNSVRTEVEFHPSLSYAERCEMLVIMASAILHVDLNEFWTYGVKP